MKAIDGYDKLRGGYYTPASIADFIVLWTLRHEGDTVLDCCMGSGSTGVAALNTGRRFIGIELNTEYFNIAKERIGL